MTVGAAAVGRGQGGGVGKVRCGVWFRPGPENAAHDVENFLHPFIGGDRSTLRPHIDDGIEHDAVAKIPGKMGTNGSVVLIRRRPNVDADFGHIGNRIDIQPAMYGADIERRFTEDGVPDHVEIKILEFC